MERKLIDFEQGWGFIQTGITKLKNNLEGQLELPLRSEEYQMLFTTVYNMCTQKPPYDYSNRLYDKYKVSCKEYITSTVLPSLREKQDEFILTELVKRWANYKVMVRWLSRIFHYLDRYFIHRWSLPSCTEVGFTCFHELVYQELSGKVKDTVISLIGQEREGEHIDRALLKNVLDIFVEIGMGQMDYYENDFEAAMLEDTAAYYARKSSNWIHEDSCPDYMLKVEDCLKQEKDRVSHYLHSSSEPKLLEEVQHELLSVNANKLLEKEHSGCHCLLRDDKEEDLSRMFRLFSKIPRGLDPVSSIFKQHVTAVGTALVKQAEDAARNKEEEDFSRMFRLFSIIPRGLDPVSSIFTQHVTAVGTALVKQDEDVASNKEVFVGEVIELHDKYLACVKVVFQNHTLFHKALKEAFEVLCNKDVAGSSSAELLATFCDNILKKDGSEKLNDKEIEEKIEKVMNLLAYIRDKDLFAEFYRKKLASRLLFDESANVDHQKSILTKLKQQYGSNLTLKMEEMVADWTARKIIDPNETQGINLEVTLLNSYAWPSVKSSDLNLPEEMVSCVTDFRKFCQKELIYKTFTWIYSLGTCVLLGKFEAKDMELIVTTYQASALLLFNSSDRLSYSEIVTLLNLTDDDVVRVLHSLSCGKYKILNKEPNTNTISSTDYFEFNSKFTDKMEKIQITLPPLDEKKKVIDVDKDRRYAIDASIVCIMKTRKVLDHQQLVMECVVRLSPVFKPDSKEIEKRIEDLINRKYLERDKDNLNLCKYLP